MYQNHVLVCVSTPDSSEPSEVNFLNMIMPLRLRSVRGNHYHKVVILCSAQTINTKEWTNLCHFPDIVFVNGSCLFDNDLSAVNAENCYSCVVLSQSHKGDCSDDSMQDRGVLLCVSKIRAYFKKMDKHIPITTELVCSHNSHLFSSPLECQMDSRKELQFTEAYASGMLFNNSFLYSCLSLFYFNPGVLNFYRTLFYGEVNSEVEAVLHRGLGFGQALPKERGFGMGGNQLCLIGLFDDPICLTPSDLKNLAYSSLWQMTLIRYGLLCLGLYRLNANGSRFVFTNPPKGTKLNEFDQVFCFRQVYFTNSIPAN